MRENRLKNGRGGTPTKLMEDGEQKRHSRGRKKISANVNAEEQQRQSIQDVWISATKESERESEGKEKRERERRKVRERERRKVGEREEESGRERGGK